jgi:hypothetical protein
VGVTLGRGAAQHRRRLGSLRNIRFVDESVKRIDGCADERCVLLQIAAPIKKPGP